MQTKPITRGRRLLALVLAVVMVCSLLPAGVLAAEPDYELRVLTFEDADYKGGTNFAGGASWSSLIDDPQYGGKLLYGDGGGVDSEEAAYKWTDENHTWLSNVLSEGYGSWCYWSGGHAISNYASGDIADYGGFNSQLTVYKKGQSGLSRTGGGHNGSNNFAVHYGYADNSGFGLGEDALPTLRFADDVARVIDHMYVNNTDYALNCYIDGNGLTAKINEGDWVKLVATGYDADGVKTGTAELYLCNGPENILMDWTKWDLSGLGKVLKVTFNVTGSSDNGYGFSQPAYFAYDDVAVRFEKEVHSVPATGVTLNRTSLTLTEGETAVLTAAVEPENTTDPVTWSSSNEEVASVTDGTVSALKAGTAVITASCGEVTAKCSVTVKASPLSVTAGNTLCPVNQVGSGEIPEYRAVVPYGSDVTINVADAFFLMVTDKKGGYLNDEGSNPFTLTAAQVEKLLLAAGDTKPFTPAATSKVAYLSIMDAMAGETYDLYLELTREAAPATGVTLDRAELTLKTGGSAVLTAAVEPKDTTDTLVWTSSDDEVASVKDGKVTAGKAGSAVITAACGSAKAECTVTVLPPVAASEVKLRSAALNLYEGDTAALTAEVLPEDTTDKTVVWSSSNDEVASVKDGKVTAVKAGSAVITAACGSAKAECTVTVKAPVEPAQKDGVYQIGTVDELIWFAKQVNGGNASVSAVLTNNIDLGGVSWTPIGGSSISFAGSFDGAGHTISNLRVEYAAAAAGERLYLGLFGQVNGTSAKRAAIRDLTVEGSVHAASSFSVYTGYVAGVVGCAKYADLSGVISRVTVAVDEKVGNASSVGGLAGVLMDSTITNCGSEGDVSGVKNMGGLCYELYSGTMTGCYNTGKVTGTGTYVGGLMGYAKQATVTDVYNTGDVSTQKSQVGGLIGVMEKSTLSNAYTTGKITTAASGNSIGAAVGIPEQVSNTYFLESVCEQGDSSAVAKTAAELRALAPTLRDGFKTNDSCGDTLLFPLLAWQSMQEHSFTNTPSDRLASEATCTDPASYYVKCDKCGAISNTVTVSVGSANGHRWDNGTVTKQPTCKDEGVLTFTCSVCNETKTEPIAKTNEHSWDNGTVTKQPTCKDEGVRTFTCSVCNETKTEPIAKTNEHSWDNGTVTRQPTCKDEGVRTFTCSVCNETKTELIAKTNEHSWDKGTVTKQPTCKDEGVRTFTCSVCNETKTEPIAKTNEHSWDKGTVTKQPTCKDEGVRTFTCSVCNETKTEPIAKTNEHSWDKGTVTRQPTCKDEGVLTFTCSVCNETKTEPIAKTNEHSWDKGTVTRQPTAQNEGVMVYVCTVCGATKFEAIARTEAIVRNDVTAKPSTGNRSDTCPSRRFVDVPAGKWYHKAVDYAVANVLFDGTSATTFEPDGSMTRAMLVTVLWRAAGQPAAQSTASFRDVDASRYYAKAVAWAKENGIAAGTSADTFSPDETVTREQLTAILYRYAGFCGADVSKAADLSSFPDAGEVSAYAGDAMAWAVESGILSGTPKNGTACLEPKGNATRAQVASILMRFSSLYG